MHRLPLADSYDDEKVHTRDNGIKLSSEEIMEEHVEDILEAGCSIEATPRTSSTGGQQQNSKINGCKTKHDKGRDKHKGKKTKVTFAELLEKYKKESEARSAYRPGIAKSSRSPQGESLKTGIGNGRSSMQQLRILPLGRQCQCHGYLPMLIVIHIHHGTCMTQGHIIHLTIDHLTQIMQLQDDHHLINNHMSKTVSIKRNRLGAQGRRRRWSRKFTK